MKYILLILSMLICLQVGSAEESNADESKADKSKADESNANESSAIESNAKQNSKDLSTETLLQRIKLLQKNHDRLVQLNSRLEETITRLEHSNARLEKFNMKLEMSNSKLEGLNLNLEKSNSQLEEKNYGLEEANLILEETDVKCKSTVSDIKVSNSTLIKLKDTNANLKKSNRELEKSNLKLIESYSELNESYLEYQALNSKLEKSLNECKLQSEVTHKKLCINENESVECQLPTSCTELFLKRPHAIEGIYMLNLGVRAIEPFEVYCLKDPVDGRGWTVIQRRMDGSVDFYRNWTEYKNGFGKLESEFWLGLEKLHEMTRADASELWIVYRNFEGSQRFAKYDEFAIGAESAKYALNVLGQFKGDTTDSLSYNKGYKFSTKDNDNDLSKDNCAVYSHSGFWFNDCTWCNLNGLYTDRNVTTALRWTDWSSGKTPGYALQYAHMAIRPKV